MKNKIINLLIILGGFFVATSCDDFLETETLSTDNLEYVCSNPTDARKMVDNVYAYFCEDSYTSRMSNNWMQNTDVEFATVSKDQAIAHNDRRGVWALNYGQFGDILTCWNHNYFAINYANMTIEGIEASEMYKNGDPTMQQLLGEAYCLRAYRYFLLCNFWGDVPFALTSSNYKNYNNTPRVDKNIIYSQMIQDLVNVEGQMQWAKDATSERMNREFALGFIVKLAMFRAGYSMQADGTMSRCRIDSEIEPVVYTDENGTQQTASTSNDFYKVAQAYARKLINLRDRQLPTDFKNVFYTQINTSSPADSDVLFEIGFMQGGGGDVAWCIGLTVAGGAKGAGSTYTYLTPSYACSFDKEDQRLPVTCASYDYLTDKLQRSKNAYSINPAKWCRIDLKTPTVDKNTGVNWPILRYPDVLLMLAEADNELNGGPTGEAREMLKRVRDRAFVNSANKTDKVDNYVANLASHDDFRQAIIKERAWEFGGECVRKFDLIRWNYYSEAVANAIDWMRTVGANAQQLDVVGEELIYDKNKQILNMNVANRLYYRINNGMIEFENDIFTARDETLEPYKSAETITDLKITEGEYSYEKLYRVDFSKGFISVSDKDGNGKAYGTDSATGDAIKKGTVSDNIIYAWYGLTDGTLILGMEDVYPLRSAVTPYVMPIPTDKVINSAGVLNNNGYAIRNK